MARLKVRETSAGGLMVTGLGCQTFPTPVQSLGDFVNFCGGQIKGDTEFWFRGHADLAWTLTPSALRYKTTKERDRALNLLTDFRRYTQIRLPHPPSPGNSLEWVQLAQHYGLPTRLLDWTRNAAIALYFASQQASHRPGTDGVVVMLSPKLLNRVADPRNPRVFDAHLDAGLIQKYLALSGERDPHGLRTIAVNPIPNSERIEQQQGTFTLHGSKDFSLTRREASSLVPLWVPASSKAKIVRELDRIGVNEMTIFPEPEHVCSYLIWRERLKE